jgi:hypothetical protein
MSFESFKVKRKGLDLFFSFCNVGLGFALFSFSAFVLMSIALLQICFFTIKREPTKVMVLIVLLLGALLSVEYFSPDTQDSATELITVQNILESPTNGLSGRFSDLGTMRSTMAYLRNKPFSPVGIGYSSNLFFGDSGIIEYYLRGSLPLVVVIYGGLLAFLRKNLLMKRDAWHVFVVILIFELGFTSLTDFHVLYFLPVLIVYFNDLRSSSIADPVQLVSRSLRTPSLLPRIC